MCASTDLAVRIFDEQELRFDLTQSQLPDGDFRWAPYVASVAVNAADRGRGIGQQLVKAAEGWATTSGYDEILLEVSDLNEAAIALYQRLGYTILSSFGPGEGGGGAEHVLREGARGFEVQETGKHVMRKELSAEL